MDVLWTEEAAGWAQFLAAIVALWIAVYAPVRHARTQSKAQAATQIKSILAIVEDGFSMVAALPEDRANRAALLEAMKKFPDAGAKMVIDWLKAIPIHALHEHRLAAPVLDLVRSIEPIRGASRRLRAVTGHESNDFINAPQFEDIVDRIFRARGKAVAAVNTIRAVAVEYSIA